MEHASLLDPAALLQLFGVALHHVHRPHVPFPPRHLCSTADGTDAVSVRAAASLAV
jgi:hypothetical protein